MLRHLCAKHCRDLSTGKLLFETRYRRNIELLVDSLNTLCIKLRILSQIENLWGNIRANSLRLADLAGLNDLISTFTELDGKRGTFGSGNTQAGLC